MNNFLFLCVASCVSLIFAQVCYDDGSEFCLDQNDILAVDLLPGSFVLAGEPESNDRSNVVDNFTADGSFNKAFSEMGYHRQRMNEYLCHGYLAEEIFTEVGPARLKRRLDSSSADVVSDFIDEDNVTTHDKLLSDEGSSKYKDWLQRTTTLNDVYQHYSPKRRTKTKHIVRPEDDFENLDGDYTAYDIPVAIPNPKSKHHYIGPSGGSATGHHANYGHPPQVHYGPPPQVHYGPPPQIHYGPSSFGPSSHGPSSHGPSAHGFIPSIHEEHYYFPPNHQEDKHIYHSKKGGEISLKDFFEIALTALAFLAFGLFIIQLLMNCVNMATATPTTVASIFADLPIQASARSKRSTSGSLPLSYSGNAELNELSHRVLRSIEASLVAQYDSGNCLRRVLCEDNRHAKSVRGGQRIWVPVWSLGMSWVSGRILNKSPWSAMLSSIKASILGLGNADCASLYAECNLERERIKRRRRRRK